MCLQGMSKVVEVLIIYGCPCPCEGKISRLHIFFNCFSTLFFKTGSLTKSEIQPFQPEWLATWLHGFICLLLPALGFQVPSTTQLSFKTIPPAGSPTFKSISLQGPFYSNYHHLFQAFNSLISRFPTRPSPNMHQCQSQCFSYAPLGRHPINILATMRKSYRIFTTIKFLYVLSVHPSLPNACRNY